MAAFPGRRGRDRDRDGLGDRDGPHRHPRDDGLRRRSHGPVAGRGARPRAEGLPLLAGGVVGFAETVSFRAVSPKDNTELWTDNKVSEPLQITTDGTSFYAADGPVDGPGRLHIRTLAPSPGRRRPG